MSRFDHYEPCPRCTDDGRDRAGDNLAVYSDGSSHCFSCGRHRFPKLPPALRHLPAPKVNGTASLPADFTREVPARGWEWLLQYGLGWKYWKPFVGWSEKDSRLVFTVGEPVSHSLGRYLGAGTSEGQKPPRKWWTYGDCHNRAHVLGQGGPKAVLVEDIISAHKVGQITECIPLFGTQIFAGVVSTLRHIGLPVLMWLDKDQDAMAARKSAWLATVTGLPVSYVSTEADPKCQTLAKIQEIVNE